MIIEHNSGQGVFREPFGAVATGQKVKLRIYIEPAGQVVKRVRLCYSYGLYEFFHNQIDMLKLNHDASAACSLKLQTAGFVAEGAYTNNLAEQLKGAISSDHAGTQTEDALLDAGGVWYEIDLVMPAEPALFFYFFRIETDRQTRWLLLDRENNQVCLQDHEPELPEPSEPYSGLWQITVFDRDMKIPSWLPGAVYYQIFPDRFNRGKDFDLKKMESLCNYPERICHSDWNEPVDYKGAPETGYIACDFFGGSLAGIIEKLPYLEEFGVDAIYLNPVFKARSNHRYDTGDYEEIDPILGDTEDMKALCQEAKKHGIRIILDGVFSHTGADSRYFNLLERYEEIGAVQAVKQNIYSPYSSWYDLKLIDGELAYDSWWGFEELPNIKEQDLSYQDYITGEEGILKKWLDLGISGWRLDVSDELPDSFIRALRKRVSQENPDAVVMGEVWEEACSKHSYGSYRDFIFGRTHHQVMGYPFQRALLSFLRGDHSAAKMLQDLERVRENYPLPVFYTNLNLISSHDTKRAITALAGQEEPSGREAQSKLRLEPKQREKGERLLKLAALFQVCYPGAISIYYGDERGLEGYSDPFNRATFPWDLPEPDLTKLLRRLARLRSMPVLRTGFYQPLLAEGDIFAFGRFMTEGKDVFGEAQEENTVLCFLNRGVHEQILDLKILIKDFSGRAKEDCSLQEIVLSESVKILADNLEHTAGKLALAPQTGLLFVDGRLELSV